MSTREMAKRQLLIDELSDGNQDAFRFYYVKYWDVVFHFIFKYSRSYELAEDGCLQVFDCVWRRRTSLYSILDLERIIALGCTSVVFRATKKSATKNSRAAPKANNEGESNDVKYPSAVQENLLNIRLMADDLNRMEQKSDEQFQAELDFMGKIITETKSMISVEPPPNSKSIF